MIGFLNGVVVFRDGNHIIIDVAGVGYKVHVASDVLSKLGNNSSLKLFIYTHVREDNISLFGFLESLDLKLFENLISISGIGPKTAMGIFSVGERDSIISAIVKADVEFFTSVPRLGKKNAQKIIIELKNKFGSLEDLDLASDDSETSEAITALQAIGYSRKEALEGLKSIKGKGETVEEKVRMALKYLGRAS